MASLEDALILLTAVVLSAVCVRVVPRIPIPLVQIGFGMAMGLAADVRVRLDPEAFFFLFLPPLLFFDGWRIPKEGLLRDRGTILALSVGLVVVSVAIVGGLIHWIIPAMPLAVAFALAAAISPTDPVAVSGMTARTPLPKRLMRILEGESLFNDATGLVCMRFALAAALTGTFSVVELASSFTWLALGGLATGIVVTWTAATAKDWVTQRYGENTGSQILISLLVPFGAYLLAGKAGCSGILAAVAAGVTMSYVEQRGAVLAITRVRRMAVWETVHFSISGVIFVLLGEQLPDIVMGAAEVANESGHRSLVWPFVYAIAITTAATALRFIFVWAALRLTLYQSDRNDAKQPISGWRVIAVMSFAGVRGTLTLASVLAFPLTLADGTAFPTRDLAVFLAAGCIVVSLVIASVSLPALVAGLRLPPGRDDQDLEDRATVAASNAALEAIARAQVDLPKGRDAEIYTDIGSRIMDEYRERIEARSQVGAARDASHHVEEIERRLRLIGARAERDEFFRLSRAGKLSDETARKLVRDVDLVETRIAGG